MCINKCIASLISTYSQFQGFEQRVDFSDALTLPDASYISQPTQLLIYFDAASHSPDSLVRDISHIKCRHTAIHKVKIR